MESAYPSAWPRTRAGRIEGVGSIISERFWGWTRGLSVLTLGAPQELNQKIHPSHQNHFLLPVMRRMSTHTLGPTLSAEGGGTEMACIRAPHGSSSFDSDKWAC